METLIKALTAISAFFKSSGIGAVTDKNAWILMAPAAAALYAIEPALATTLLQWTLFGIVLAGAAVVISRLIFPQIELTALVKSAWEEKNTAAGLIVSAVVLFVGVVMLSLVLWAKA